MSTAKSTSGPEMNAVPAPDAPASPASIASPAPRTSEELDKSLFQGIAWTGGVKYATQFVSYASSIIVARLLTPADYGLVSMATVFLGFITLFSEFGIGAAIVTLRDLTEDQIRQINAFSVLLGIAGCLVTITAAYPLGWFFRSQQLPHVVMVMSVAFLITGFKAVPSSLLERELRFKTISVIDGVRAIVLAFATVLFALAGFRYWTLVMSGILSSLLSTLMTLRANRAAFRYPRLSGLRSALTFSWHILVGRLCWYVYSNADFAVAGRVLGQLALGGYTVAWSLSTIPIQTFSSLFASVTPGLFSAVQHSKADLRRYLLSLTEGLSIVTFPLTIGLALVAKDFIQVFLGAKWLSIVAPLQLLAAYAAVRSITPLLAPILNVTGEARFGMRIGLVTLAIFPAGFYIASHWGTFGIAAGWMILHPITMLPIYIRTFKKIELSATEYLKALRPATHAVLLMAAFVLVVHHAAWQIPTIARFVLEVSAGAFAYVGSIILFHRSRLQLVYQRFRQARAA